MNILAIMLVVSLSLSAFMFVPANVEAVGIPDAFDIEPTWDVFTVPDIEPPGVGAVIHYYQSLYDGGLTNFSHVLAVNHTDYQVTVERLGGPVFWMEMRFDLEDVAIDMDWNQFEISVYTVRGANAFWYYYGYLESLHEYGNMKITNSNGWFHDSTNPSTGVTFTKDEINSLQGRFVQYVNTTAQCFYKYYKIHVTPVIDSAQSAVQYILRPDAFKDSSDIESNIPSRFEPWINRTEDDVFDELNETTAGGDGLTSYISPWETDVADGYATSLSCFEFTNLPSWASRTTTYTIIMWAIADCPDYYTPNQCPIITFGPYQTVFQYDWWTGDSANWPKVLEYEGAYGLNKFRQSPYNTNSSSTYPTNPQTSLPWTYASVNTLVASLYGPTVGLSPYEYNIVNVTQFGVIAIPGDYISPIGEDFEGNVYGLLWLILIFIPGIIVGSFTPIGFIVGTLLMLIVLSLYLPGFVPVLLIGLLGYGIVLFKGG